MDKPVDPSKPDLNRDGSVPAKGMHRRGFIKLALIGAAAPLVYAKPSIAQAEKTSGLSPIFTEFGLVDVIGMGMSDACGNQDYLFNGTARSSVYGNKVTLTEVSITGIPNGPGDWGVTAMQISNANAMRGFITGPGGTGDLFSGTAKIVYSDNLNAAAVRDVDFSGEIVGDEVIQLTITTLNFNGLCKPANPATMSISLSGPTSLA